MILDLLQLSLQMIGLGSVMILVGVGLLGASVAGTSGEDNPEDAEALTALHKTNARQFIEKGRCVGHDDIDPDDEIAAHDTPYRN